MRIVSIMLRACWSMVFLFFIACSNQQVHQDLARQVELFTLDYELFINEIDRYHEEKVRLTQRKLGILASAFLEEGTDRVIPEILQISQDAQQFKPEALRLYLTGCDLAYQLQSLYSVRDSLVGKGHLEIELHKLSTGIDETEEMVGLIREEVVEVIESYSQVLEKAIEAHQAYKQSNEVARLREKFEKAKLKYEFEESWLTPRKAQYPEYPTTQRDEALRQKNQAWKEYSNHPLRKAFMETSKAEKEAKAYYEQRSKRLREDLEQAYLEWNWLAPYLNRLIRDI